MEQAVKHASPGERFPTDAKLAKRFGVSKSTIRRELEHYRDSGIVERIPGKGTFLAGVPRHSTAIESHPLSSAENIADHLRRAIATGILRRGQALPPIKRIVYQFRVSAATVQRAYRLLSDSGLITKVGRTYWIGTFEDALLPQSGKTICVLGQTTADMTGLFSRFTRHRAYQKMEHELLVNGYVVDFLPLDKLPKQIEEWRNGGGLPYGFVFRCNDQISLDQILPIWETIRALATRDPAHTPGLLLEVPGTLRGGRPSGVEVLSQGHISTGNARKLARYLVSRKCREASFLVLGSRESAVPTLAKVRAELKHLDPEFGFRIVGIAATSQGRESLRTTMVRSIDTPPWTVDAILGKYEAVPREALVDEIVVLRSFDELLEVYPGGRMWVFEQDAEAAQALTWANTSGVDVPESLSIITTDHHAGFLHLGFTCCFPDFEQIGYQMAHALIGDRPITRTSKGLIRTRSLLVENKTTKAAP